MQKGNVSAFDSPQVRLLLRMPLPRAYTDHLGRKLLRFLLTVQGLGAFALITLGVLLKKFRTARQVIRPLILHETSRAGLRLLPMFLFLGHRADGLVVDASGRHKLSGHDHGDRGRARAGAVADCSAGAGAHRHGQCGRIGHRPGAGRSRGAGGPGDRSGALPGRPARDRHGHRCFCADGLPDSRGVDQRLSLGVHPGRAAAAR